MSQKSPITTTTTTTTTTLLSSLTNWLTTTSPKIQQFWIGADWRLWARFDLFTSLEDSMTDCLVTHSNSDFWRSGDDEVDILVEPRDGDGKPVAIVLCCEKVNENEGSYEEFVRRWDEAWVGLQGMGPVESDFEGVTVLLVGFGGEPVGDGLEEFKTEPRPDVFRCGEVRCYHRGFEPKTE